MAKIEKESDLRKFVIKGDRALACCKSAESAVQLDITKIIGQYLAAVLAITSGNVARNSVLALVPGAPLGRILVGIPDKIFAGLSRTALVGSVIILEAAVVASIATSTGALEAASGLATAIGQMLSDRADKQNRCFDCMSKNVLSQSARRHRVRTKILKRIGGAGG